VGERGLPMQLARNSRRLLGRPRCAPDMHNAQISLRHGMTATSSCFIVEKTAQPLRARRMAQLAQRFRFYLADALARDVELFADFL
jgi:hypothetical protein